MNDINKISINGTTYKISDLSFEVPILSSAPTASTLTYDSGNKTFVVNQMCKVAESSGLYTYYRLHSISGTSPNQTAVWSKEGSVDESDLTGFASKVSSATSGHLAGLDSNGNLTDSGVASSTVVTLVDGKVPSSVLPSYVDDVIELLDVTDTAPSTCAKDDLYYNTSSKKIFTATATDTWGSTGVDPEKGKIYVNLDDEKIYRWSGTAMAEISSGSDVDSITNQEIYNLFGGQSVDPSLNANVVTTNDLATVATTGSYDDLIDKPTIPTSLPASDVSAWAKAANKPSYAYGEITYNKSTVASVSGAVTVNGATPVHELTATAAISSISFTTAVPEDGHSCHLIIKTGATSYTAAISDSSTVTIDSTTYTFVCPGHEDLSLTIPANGYVELDLLRIGTNIYVRGV